jgi:hypothetical protein
VDSDRVPIASSYDTGRGYSPEVLEFWRDAVAATVVGSEVETILDLGCGTGRFSAPPGGSSDLPPNADARSPKIKYVNSRGVFMLPVIVQVVRSPLSPRH